MSMFPGPGAVVYRNEAGEPLGWDYPSSDYDDGWQDDDRYDDRDHYPECDVCGAEFDINRSDERCDDCVEENGLGRLPAQDAPIREDFGHFGDSALCGE